jgi:predicted ATP-dependent endonuclease of OLD family
VAAIGLHSFITCMRISNIKVTGFRSLVANEVKLADYNTMVGKNYSGKSNFLRALRILFDPNKIAPFDIGSTNPKTRERNASNLYAYSFTHKDKENNT